MRRALLVLAIAACPRPAPVEGPRPIDRFDSVAAWQASGSDGVTASVRGVPGARGQALQLSFDFGNTAGYAVARRELPPALRELPPDFELTLQLRGDLPVNNLELKLTDETGENVWWYRRADYEFPRQWRELRIKRKQIEFAWGPIADHTLRRAHAIELVVSTGAGGGKGTIEIDELALRAVPPVTGPPPAPVSTWQTSGGAATLTIDHGRERDFGGVLVSWGATFPAAYTVEASRDGAAWQPIARITGGDGGLDPLPAPETSARYLRLVLPEGRRDPTEVALIDAATPTALVEEVARRLPRGSFPRGFIGEQPYWTVVGVDGGGDHASLMSEDGALELATGATIEPFVEAGGKVTSWATAPEIAQSLDDEYLPIPRVTWRAPAWELTVTALADGALADGPPGQTRLAARYTLRNRTDQPQALRLVLAVRPLQVNPPRQFLNIAGGVRKIARLAWSAPSVPTRSPVPSSVPSPVPSPVLSVDGAPALALHAPPDAVALWPLHAIGYPTARIAPTPPTVEDPAALASGALAYDIALAPGAERSIVVTAPLGKTPPSPGDVDFDALLAAARTAWHDRLDRVGFRVPPDGAPLIHALRSSLAYMLISRAGPILRPGTRSYARAWIRDGAMIGEALLRLGHPQVAIDFLRWYAPYQFASGKVPCCVEARGAVPVPENDSHGQLIHLAAEIARYTGDRALLAALWPSVAAAARYLEELRQSERTPANQTPARRAQYGLLPPTISHEGYSAKAAYSYWDDFWGLVGFRDAAWIARALDRDPAALVAQGDEFERDLLASIAASVADHRIDYIPGAAELGDYDATSTTIALSPGGAQHLLPRPLLERTFERAWQTLDARAPDAAWDAYTPYELRLVGAFVRLGWRDRARAALARYFADQRPRAWNQWAEVVGRVPREPRFVGDMPHAWVHSDYARSVLDMFAYARDDGAWAIAAGVPAAWFDVGFAIERLPTPFGALSYEVTATPRAITIRIDAGALPAGGLVLPWPLAGAPGATRVTRINGKPARWRGAELVIAARPATITIAKDP